MKNTLLLILLLCCTIIACKDDEEMPSEEIPVDEKTYLDIDIVTGLRLYDQNASPVGIWRAPNDEPRQTTFYPNPSVGEISMFSMDSVEQIWITAAECLHDSLTNDIIDLPEMVNFGVDEISMLVAQEADLESPQVQLILNLEALDSGFYKVFFQLQNGELGWQNVYVDSEVMGFPDFERLDAACE